MYSTIIIGGGVAGYSAAMYARRYELDVLLITDLAGGTITKTHLVENYPGFPSLTGYELATNIMKHAEIFQPEIKMGQVVQVRKEEEVFTVKLKNGTEFQGKTIIIATGTKHRELNISSEAKFKNKGVSYCATCDGAFFKNKTVGVVGGSDSAVKESLLLSQYAAKVYIIYRKAKVRPEPINKKRMEAENKIEVINNSNVVEILGPEKVTGVLLDTGKKLSLEGLFIEIGRIPQTSMVQDLGLNLNNKGEIITNKYAQTNIKGVFAAGDVSSSDWKQAIVSASEGAHAANSAFNYLQEVG